VLFGADGELLGRAVSSYETDYPGGNRAEQDPADWWRAVCDSTREIMRGHDPKKVAAIAFSGQMMGCLCVDAAGRPLRKHILYSDQRAQAEERTLIEKAGAETVYTTTGHRPSASYAAAKLMWVKNNEPGVYAATRKMLHAKDYLNFRLTGRMVTEPSDASGTNLYSLADGAWSPALVAASGLDPDKLPEIVPSTAVVGELTSKAAKALGLVPGIPVAAGAGDGLCSGVGVGSVSPGKTYNYLGSSSWISTTSAAPVFDPGMRTFTWAHAVPGLFHPTGTTQTAAASYAWLKREVCTSETAAAEAAGLSPYELMNRAAEASSPGAGGLVYLPYLQGERAPRWDTHAKGAFIGLTMRHGRAEIIRSVLEGVSMNLAIIFDIFRAQGPIHELVVIGGGAKGALWRQIMADIYEVEILRSNMPEEATSIGAAIIGGVGVGLFPGFEVAGRFFSVTDRTRPRPELYPMYRRKKELFEACYQALKPVYPLFAALPL
jgi:xylulokinase